MKIPWPLNMFKSPVPATNPPPSAGAHLPAIARLVVEDRLRGTLREIPLTPQGYLAQRSGVFVTIRTRNGRLRGCRGTVSAVHHNLIEETKAVALSSAFQDERFAPVQVDELENLSFEVSVLHAPEPVDSTTRLEPAIYGIIVRAADGRHALMLPGVEGLEKPDQQLDATRRKALIEPDEPVEILRFRVDKFTET